MSRRSAGRASAIKYNAKEAFLCRCAECVAGRAAARARMGEARKLTQAEWQEKCDRNGEGRRRLLAASWVP